MGTPKQHPYKSFGDVLKKHRADALKTPAEVSGAVEIEEDILKEYESGQKRPDEDILMLLISHFELKDEQASELWKLAGYSGNPTADRVFMNDDYGDAIEISLNSIATNQSPIVYTDLVQVLVNNYGVIVNFMQGAGPGQAPLAVSKVGMSKEHAKSLIDVLQRTLDQAENPPAPKQIEGPQDSKPSKK